MFFSEVWLGLFAIFKFPPAPSAALPKISLGFQRDNKGLFTSPIFIPHEPATGFCLNMTRVFFFFFFFFECNNKVIMKSRQLRGLLEIKPTEKKNREWGHWKYRF